ncbi:MAG: hypothetical protein M3490_01740, partial [Chloroflexota bacterium]|nr:hypothetical protein [Chloroflexota bacterium]
ATRRVHMEARRSRLIAHVMDHRTNGDMMTRQPREEARAAASTPVPGTMVVRSGEDVGDNRGP